MCDCVDDIGVCMKKRLTIAYGFSNCSDKEYKKLFDGKNKFVMVTDQKYHTLLQKGLRNNGATVYCYSGLPINRDVTRKAFISEKDDVENDIHYHYYTTINLPVIRQLMIFCAGFFNILFSRRKFDFLICDFMSTMNSFGMALAAKTRRVPVVEIVMDLPGLMNTTGEPVQGVYKRLSNLADGYVLLTKQMSDVINPKKKPHIVLEGHVDAILPEVTQEEKWEVVTGKRVIIYAGGIHKIFGIENLVKGFIKAEIENSELRIFGDGDYREELERICKNHRNIKYMGVVDNKDIVYQEQRAALLVNPRPSEPIYTRYSFPSKNMEYMVSGTPVLTTNLPGMPEEYKDYVYIIKDETVDGVASALKEVLKENTYERAERGRVARDYVIKNKNNDVQAERIVNFIKNEVVGNSE